jgi:hypothetical protein
MTDHVQVRNARGALTVRPSDGDLHRAACKALQVGGHEIFRALPSLLDQIIEYKIWKSRNFKSFGEYALDQTSEGLGISNNQLLWILKCALDVDGKHIKEWASVLQEVEKCVRVHVKKMGMKIMDFHGNSLETLGKKRADGRAMITYLPSRSSKSDRQLVRNGVRGVQLRRQDSDVNRDPVARAIMYVKRMEPADIKRLVKWLTEEGYVK